MSSKKILDYSGLSYFWSVINNLKANLASPTFTGTPTAPTAAAGTNTTQIATTAFVKTAVDGLGALKGVQVNGTDLTISNDKVNVDLSNYATKSDITSVYKYKGTVSTYGDLPSSGQVVGDTYNVETADSTNGIKAGDNVAWTGSAWDVLAGTVDLSGYATTSAMNTALADKVDATDLVSITDAEIDAICV